MLIETIKQHSCSEIVNSYNSLHFTLTFALYLFLSNYICYNLKTGNSKFVQKLETVYCANVMICVLSKLFDGAEP